MAARHSSKNNTSFLLSVAGLALIILTWCTLMISSCHQTNKNTIVPGTDTVAIKKIADSAFMMYRSDPKAGILLGQIALNISTQSHWIRGQSLAQNSIASNFFAISRYDSAFDHFIKSADLNHQIKYRKGLASNLTNIGAILHEVEDFDESILFLDSAYNIYDAEKEPLLYEKATIMLDKGASFNQLGRSKEAAECYLFALNAFMHLGDQNKDAVAQVYHNIANVYYKDNDFVNARLYYNNAAVYIYEKKADDFKPALLTNLSLVYLNCPDADLKEFGIPPASRFDTVSKLIKKAEQATKPTDSLSLADIHSAKADLYAKQGEFEKANYELKASYAFKYSLLTMAGNGKEALAKARMKHEIEKILEEKEAQKKAQEEADQSKTNSAVLFAFGLALVIVPALLIFLRLNISFYVIRSLGIIGIVLVTESIQFLIHYFTHRYITDQPLWILFVLILIAVLIITPIHDKLHEILMERIKVRKEKLKTNESSANMAGGLNIQPQMDPDPDK